MRVLVHHVALPDAGEFRRRRLFRLLRHDRLLLGSFIRIKVTLLLQFNLTVIYLFFFLQWKVSHRRGLNAQRPLGSLHRRRRAGHERLAESRPRYVLRDVVVS